MLPPALGLRNRLAVRSWTWGLGLVGTLGLEGPENLPPALPRCICRWSPGQCCPDLNPTHYLIASQPSLANPYPRLGRRPRLGWEGLRVLGIPSQVTGMECGQPAESRAEAGLGARWACARPRFHQGLIQ